MEVQGCTNKELAEIVRKALSMNETSIAITKGYMASCLVGVFSLWLQETELENLDDVFGFDSYLAEHDMIIGIEAIQHIIRSQGMITQEIDFEKLQTAADSFMEGLEELRSLRNNIFREIGIPSEDWHQE